MDFAKWYGKLRREKRASLRTVLALWCDEVLGPKVDLATLTGPQRTALLKAVGSALDRAEAAYRKAAGPKLTAPEVLQAGRSAPPSSPRGSAEKYLGQAEFGDSALRANIPPYLPGAKENPELSQVAVLPNLAEPRPTSSMVVDPVSLQDYRKGPPGSAWGGLLQLGARTDRSQDVLFLTPLVQAAAAFATVKYRRERSYARASKGGFLTPHAAFVHWLAKQSALAPKSWNDIDPKFLTEQERYHEAGCFYGFFLVKGEQKPYFNLGCQSLNRFTNGRFGSAPRYPEKLTVKEFTAWMHIVQFGRPLDDTEAALLGKVERHHWPFPDPASNDPSLSREQMLERFRAARDAIQARLPELDDGDKP